MHKNTGSRAFQLAMIFIKEQLKEPTALFWILLSPGAVFYLLIYSKGDDNFNQDYSAVTAWFYAYISSSVAFFGFSFYIIGRRESGFIRSFIYTPHARAVFLIAQLIAYSTIACLYCLFFYMMTRLPFGGYSTYEASILMIRFYSCFILFCSPGLLITALPLNFQTANAVFSILSFIMLALGVAQAALPEPTYFPIELFNLLSLGKSIMQQGIQPLWKIIISIFATFIIALLLACKYLRINPVWSRY